jgi:hypothetical protein
MKRYTKEHEWVELEGDIALVGISKHAADELGDITFVELPAIGTDVIVGDPVTVVESVKAARYLRPRKRNRQRGQHIPRRGSGNDKLLPRRGGMDIQTG